METKEKEEILRDKFGCAKGDFVFFNIKMRSYRGIVIDLIAKDENIKDYIKEDIPESRNKCQVRKDGSGLAIDCVLLGVNKGIKNKTTYYTSINIMV